MCLWRNIYAVICPTFKLGCLLITESKEFLIYFEFQSFIGYISSILWVLHNLLLVPLEMALASCLEFLGSSHVLLRHPAIISTGMHQCTWFKLGGGIIFIFSYVYVCVHVSVYTCVEVNVNIQTWSQEVMVGSLYSKPVSQCSSPVYVLVYVPPRLRACVPLVLALLL